MGRGGGSGEGRGQGRGLGKGQDVATNIAAGSACAVCFTVCMCLIGIPALLIGIVLVAVFDSGVLFDIGLTLLIFSILFTVGGIVMIILICTGFCGKYNRGQHTTVVQPAPINTTIVVAGTQQIGGPAMYGTQPPGYTQHPQGQYQGGQAYPGGYGAPMAPQYGEPPPQYGQVPPAGQFAEAPPTYYEQATPRQPPPTESSAPVTGSYGAPPEAGTSVQSNDGPSAEPSEQVKGGPSGNQEGPPLASAPPSDPPPYSTNVQTTSHE